MAKENRTLLFLKSTGALIGELNDKTPVNFMDLTQFDTLNVEIDEEAGEYFYGNYSQWEIRNYNNRPVISESVVKYGANVKILDRYPVHKQLNLIIDVLKNNESIVKTEAFNEMVNFLDTQRTIYQEKVASFQASDAFHWISEDEEEAIKQAKRGVSLL